MYPQAQIETGIVHLIRNLTTLASWQEGKGLAAALKPVCHAANAQAAGGTTGCFCGGPLGQKISHCRGDGAPPRATGHPVLRLPARGTQDYLHYQYDRKSEYAAAKSSRIGATSRPARLRRNYSSWHCVTSKKIGRLHRGLGHRPPTNLLSCSKSDSPTQSIRDLRNGLAQKIPDTRYPPGHLLIQAVSIGAYHLR